MTDRSDDFPADSPPLEVLDDRGDARLSRREFLSFMGATLAATACGDMPQGASMSTALPGIVTDRGVVGQPAPRAPKLPDDPFQLGVASGDPLADGFILWTRLAPAPLKSADAGMPPVDVPVTWELARDEQFGEPVASGWVKARPQLGHSVHVDVRGLPPDTWFYYRFRIGDDWVSPTGRTRTFPHPDSSPDSFKLVTASCQNYPSGHYTAHHHIAREDIDAVAFLGDYIYEYGRGGPVRRHNSGPLRSLQDFRRRYALYKADANLQAAHQRCPWMMTWDDHEVSNNYTGEQWAKAEAPTENFRRLRAAAYQAYYENLPLRVPFPPESPKDLRIFRSFDFGDLAKIYVLDGRQYRSNQACEDEAEFGVSCDELGDPSRTMLGERQKSWLVDAMAGSEATWNAIAQQTVFSPLMLDEVVLNPDQWDGYQAERQHLIDFIARHPVDNVTVLTGDIHTAFFNSIHRDPQDSQTELVGQEIVATSISSSSSRLDDTEGIRRLVLDNFDYVKHFNPTRRGYCLLEYTPEHCRVKFRTVDTVAEPEAEVSTDAEFLIEAGSMDLLEAPERET